MNSISITSLEDPRIIDYRELKSSNLTRYSGRFIAEGEKPALRLLESGLGVESVLVAESYLPRVSAAVPADTVVFVVPDRMIKQVVGFNFHRGIVACGKRPEAPPLADFLERQHGRLTIVVCADVQAPDNLGSLLRTSAALGVDAVVLGPKSGDPYSRRVVRVSMGSALRMPIFQSHDLETELRTMREQFAIELAAAVTDRDAERLPDARRGERFALVFGNEGHGLTPRSVALCQRRITIPMPRGVDSLNVGVAAGIFIYHFALSSS